MHCRYCGLRIVWMEGHGWLLADSDHPFGIYHTQDCAERDDPINGHAMLDAS